MGKKVREKGEERGDKERFKINKKRKKGQRERERE